MKKLIFRFLPLSLLGLMSSSAFATDFSSLTGAIDFASVTTGVLAASATILAVYIAIKGVKWILGFVRSA